LYSFCTAFYSSEFSTVESSLGAALHAAVWQSIGTAHIVTFRAALIATHWRAFWAAQFPAVWRTKWATVVTSHFAALVSAFSAAKQSALDEAHTTAIQSAERAPLFPTLDATQRIAHSAAFVGTIYPAL
jgi:hypothetical protein